MSEFARFKPGAHYIPPHHRPKTPLTSLEADWMEIARAFGLDVYQAAALKYVLRAGRKEGQSYEKDLTKAMEVLDRALAACSGGSPSN